MSKSNPSVRESLVEALSQSSMLQYLGKSEPYGPELREMLSSSDVQQFSNGDIIISEGEESDRMYVLASGSVSISVNEQEICTMSDPGEIFGEFGALTGELRSATVRAMGECTCLAVSPLFTSRISLQGDSLFSQLVQRALTKILLGRLRQTSGELATAQQALKSAEQQVAFLRVDNETLEDELGAAKKKIREGLRGTRGGEV
jgi:CRP-like cAMP-binding protein